VGQDGGQQPPSDRRHNKVLLTTNAWNLAEPAWYCPSAEQLLAVAQDTEPTPAFPPALSAAEPGTSIALPQRPLVSVTTNPW